ncbi:MAG: hypothetical protein ACHP7D_09290 [Lysobacterales bacterium]
MFAIALCALPAKANPLTLIGETYSHWKDRLFGAGHAQPAVIDAPASGPVAMQPGHPQRVAIDAGAPMRDFAKGRSHYRLIELAQPLEHAAVRVQVVTRHRDEGRGREAFKPLLYVLGDGDNARDPVEVSPLHIDIRPFRRTRLLGCVTLDNVQRFAIATAADAIGKSYASDVRDAVKAPTPGGFYYTTDAVKVRLPYAATGILILEITREDAAGKGC